MAFGFAIAPYVFSQAIALFGWLLFQDNPEMCGLWMDGENAFVADIQDKQKEDIRAEPL